MTSTVSVPTVSFSVDLRPQSENRMPKKSRGKVAREDAPTAPDHATIAAQARRSHLRRELGGIVLLLAAVFIAGSLLVGGAAAGRSCTSAGGIFGPVGLPACARGSSFTLGALSARSSSCSFLAVHALRLLGRIEESREGPSLAVLPHDRTRGHRPACCAALARGGKPRSVAGGSLCRADRKLHLRSILRKHSALVGRGSSSRLACRY